jgi:AcrR family transcriptional regulator
MEAASELIHEQGVPQLRVEEVATQAGLSVGTFYLYFDGKDDLFAHLVIDYTERLRERVRAAYAGPGTLIERMERSLEAYLAFVEENEKGFLYFRDAGTIQTRVGRLSTWAFDQHAADLLPLLEEGMASGEYRSMDPQRTAQAIVGLVQHMAGWWLEHRDECPREDLARFLLTLTGLGLQR